MGGNGRWAWPALFLAPQYLVSTVFLLAPIAAGVLFSFFRVSPVSISWLGFNNYRSIIHDSVFHGAFVNTILFMVVNVPLTLLLGLAVALVIHPLRPKYQSIFRITFYLPVILGVVVISMVWAWIFDPIVGLLNYLLGILHLPQETWLADPHLALPSLMLVVFTFQFGEAVIILLAGLGGIPMELIEAARVEGAGMWEVFRLVTLPLLRPAVLFTLVTQTIAVSQVWVVAFILTGGGPANATETVGLEIYQTAFSELNMGLAAAEGVVLMLVVGLVVLGQFRLMRGAFEL